MANIAINDLDINQELDNNALQNILGGRWVRRSYYRKVRRVRYYSYRKRVVSYRTVRRRSYYYTRVRRTRWVWV